MTDGHLNSASPFEISNPCRKHVVFVDAYGVADVVPVLRRMAATGNAIEWNHIGEGEGRTPTAATDNLISAERWWPNLDESDALRAYLGNQPMGTHLYIAASWVSARTLVRVGETVGYAKEDIQVCGYGQKYHQVFCIACYSMNPIGGASTIQCRQCGKVISVSNHYSTRLDAVLGYLCLDNSTEKANS